MGHLQSVQTLRRTLRRAYAYDLIATVFVVLVVIGIAVAGVLTGRLALVPVGMAFVNAGAA